MATNVNANFNYNANFGPVINQMRQLMTQANLLNQTLQNFDKQASGLKLSLGDSLASDIGKMGGWNAKVIELSDSVGQFGKALQKQELSLKQYAKEGIGAFSTASNAHKLAVREVAREMSQLAILGEKNGKQMGMMITPANINLKDFNTNLAVSRKQFDIFNTIVQDGATKLINFGKNTQWAGRQITVGLTVPLTMWGNQMSKIFREVNVELTRFQKVYGSGLMSSGDAETLKMTENVKQLGVEFSRTMGIAVKDTAALAAELAATGLEGQKLMNALRETTRLATLGDVSNQDAMKTTLSLQNAFKTSTDELAHSVDFLNAVENQTSLSLSDLTTAIPKAGPVIKALGGDVKDLSLLMVALKEGGISAAEGANALKSGMASLINPTKRATEIAAQYGINIKQIVQANRGQLMPTIIEFQKQLQLLDNFGKAQVIENIFGKYQFARISALFDNLNASSSQTMQVMELMGKSQKDLAANSYLEMDTLMNSGAKRFQRATESIKSQFIDIGGSITSAITPIIESVSSKIGKVIKFFEKLPAPVKSFIKVAVGLTAIAGPIIMIAGVFSNFLGYITKGAMSIVNLGRRMSGIPVEKFKMLDDTQIMAQKSTDALSQAFDLQKTSVEKLNSVLAVYKKHLGDAITLNPNFVNVQVAQQTTTGSPPVPKFQKGGSAWVPGSGDGDKVPAMLEPGEFVVNKKAAAQNSGLLHDINFRQAPRFQSGGRIGSADGGFRSSNPSTDAGFIGPLPWESFHQSRPGVYGFRKPDEIHPYPFSSRDKALEFGRSENEKGNLTGRMAWKYSKFADIGRRTNDPVQEDLELWIEGHRSKTIDATVKSLLGPLGVRQLTRGTLLGGPAKDLSATSQKMLLDARNSGNYSKLLGKDLYFRGLQAFSEHPQPGNVSKFINTKLDTAYFNEKYNNGPSADAMLPIFFKMMTTSSTMGTDISKIAKRQNYMGMPVSEAEVVLNNQHAKIQSVQSDVVTKQLLIGLQALQMGGRVNGYAGSSYGHGKFGPEDLQNALKSWISPMMTGLRPFNNPTKTGGIQPYGEQYPGFFADIFNQSMSPQDNKHFMRAMQFDRKGSNMSPVAGTIMDAIQMAQQGNVSAPRLQYGNGPFEMRTTRFTSFSDNPEVEFYKRFMSMFEKPKNSRSAESRARKIESGQIFPFIHDLWTGKGNGINGIPVSDLFQGQTQYGNEGETVLPGGITMPITGYGSDLKTKMLMLHSVMPGATKNINGREVPLFQMGGMIQSAEGGMPQKYADKQAAIEQMLALAHLEATTGRFANMPVTDIGQRQSGMGGFSSAIPGVNGVYEINGQKFIVKGHDTLDSALIESRGTQLTRDMFGLTTPEQELIKLGHPNTGQQMFGVRSPFDARFAQTSGQIAPDAFFKQALAAIIRGDADLQADNLFDGIVTDVGAGYVSDRASQPRTLSGKKNDVETQARINFLMQKGGARRWFAEATAGIAGSMTPEQYEAGFLNAIAQAQANAGGAIGALQNLTPEEKAMYELLQGDLSAASKIDWKAIHAHHAGVTPEPVKPKSAPTAKALEKKAADAAEREQALKAGFPAWMQNGGKVSSAADGINTMFYGTGHGIKKGSAPKDWKQAIAGGLASKLIQDRSSNARKFGIGNSDRIEIAHTKSDVYKKIFGQNAKQWDGTEIFEVGLINNMLNMLDGTGVVGKFANKWMGNAAHIQPDSISEGNKLFKALGNAVPHLGDKDAPQGNSRNWILGAYKFLSNRENIEYYGKKIKLNDYIRGDLSRLQTLPEDIPKNLRDKITSKQMGGKINGFDSKSMIIDNNKNWKSRASAPKQYEGILRTLPDWATKGTELQAIVAALQSAGIAGSERLAGYYMRDALAHINPMTTNDGEVYTKIWEAMNLMKESGVYNTFIETLRSRKDIQSRGGLLAPHVIDGVVAQTGLSRAVVTEQLTKLSSGVHPSTREGGMVLLALARMFPSTGAGRGMPIGVAAGMEARLQGDFYETLQSRALPAGLPTVKKVTVNGESKTPQSRTRSGLPGAPTMPKIVYPSRAGGGYGKVSDTGATVNVSPDGKILSNTIDDMLVTSASGHPLAVSSRELLAVTPDGTVAGVTSPGDEARKNIVHPMGTQLIRGKNFKAKSAMGGMSDAVYEGNIQPGNMQNFAANLTSMIGVVGQLQFAFSQFTNEVQNGTAKWVAATGLGVSALQLFADNGMSSVGQMLKEKGSIRQGLEQRIDPLTMQPMVDASGNALYTGKSNGSLTGKGMSKLGSGLGKLASGLGNPLVQIGLQVGIAAINKSIEMYQKAMEDAKKAGNAAFSEPTETAKLMGVQLKSLTASTEAYAKAAVSIFGAQGKGAYDKAFEKTVKTDYTDLIDVLKKTKNMQEQNNQLINVYGNLIQRGMDPKNAKELTAEIARQGQALAAFNQISKGLDKIKTPTDAMQAQVNTLRSTFDVQQDILKNAKNPTDASWYTQKTSENIDFMKKRQMKQQFASQIGATLKAAFAISAEAPVASNEAVQLVVDQFKNADWGKAKTEIENMVKDAGFGDLSKIGQFVKSDDGFKALGDKAKSQFLIAFNAGMGPELEKALKDGLTQEEMDRIFGQAAENQALVSIKAEVDIQLEDSKKQLDLLKDAIQKTFAAAIDAKKAELDVEDKRHEKALANLDAEAERLGRKKEQLAQNTEYYLKELQRESQAEDYYAKQRETGIGGLKSLASGDVFGFIGAQAQAASQSDQFGRDRSMQNIQETADSEQKKLDDALKGIDDRKKAEDLRHQTEVDNINNEIALLQKKESVTVGQINTALDLIQKAEAMQVGSKGYTAAVTAANTAAEQAGLTARVNTQGLTLPAGTDKDIVKSFNSAKKDLGDALGIMSRDTTDAVDRLNSASKIAKNVFKSLSIPNAETTKEYKDVFTKLQTPLDPTISEAIDKFVYGAVNNQKTGVVLATGGAIYGAGTATSDSIPAMLSNGEFVMNAASVKKYGTPMMHAINAGKYATGGGVGVMPRTSVPNSPSYNVPSTPSISPASIAGMAGGGSVGDMNSNSPNYNFNFNGAGMDMVMGHVNKAIGGTISSNSRGVYA